MSLYKTDYYLWVVETVNQLQSRDFTSIDWENLIEEVWDLGRSEKMKLKSLLRNLFEHLLKLTYWESEIYKNKFHWRGEIRNFRQQIQDELKDSPSLKNYLDEVLLECYQDAKEIFADKSQIPLSSLPEISMGTLEEILDAKWLPNQ